MSKPDQITKKHHRTKAQIQQDYPFVTEKAKEIREVFGGYSKVKVFDDGELVYSWEKKEPFKEPTNLLKNDRKRKPTMWRTDK